MGWDPGRALVGSARQPTRPPVRLVPLCLALAACSIVGCRVEPLPAPPSDADSTTTAGGFDRPPVLTIRPREPGPAIPPPRRADTTLASDSAAEPNPRQANPPAVDPEGAPPAPPRAAAAGRLLLPVDGITPDDLTNTFTAARSAGRQHNAIDIMAPRGRTVRAAVTGEVLRLFTSERGGLTVYQLGPSGRTVYYYAHLDSYAPGLEDGQVLAQGDPVGTVGDTGNAAPGNTHLHFAMWRVDDPAQFWDGEPINPYPLLTAK